MVDHVFHEIYLHLVWHTKDDLPLLTGELETTVHDYLRRKCQSMKGVYLDGLGGTATHVHLSINIEPFVCISDIVKTLKGSSSHDLNAEAGHAVLQWQRGYGVVSFAKKDVAWVLDYLARQPEHHGGAGKLSSTLERHDTYNEGEA